MAQAHLISSDASTQLSMVAVSEMDNRCYIFTAPRDPGDTLLVDAAAQPADLAEAVGTKHPSSIVLTHQHHDHTGALKDMTGPQTAVLAHGMDAPAITEMRGVGITRLLEDGESFSAGGATFQVIWLRGHTPGSIALATQVDGKTYLLTGDSLFPGGVGNTDGDAERFATLIDDVENKLFGKFGDDAVVLPGHGDRTTLGAERPKLAEWRERGW